MSLKISNIQIHMTLRLGMMSFINTHLKLKIIPLNLALNKSELN